MVPNESLYMTLYNIFVIYIHVYNHELQFYDALLTFPGRVFQINGYVR